MKVALLGVLLLIFIIFYMFMILMFALAFKVVPLPIMIDIGVKTILGLALAFIVSFITLIIEEAIHHE